LRLNLEPTCKVKVPNCSSEAEEIAVKPSSAEGIFLTGDTGDNLDSNIKPNQSNFLGIDVGLA
jgi:hypothetical protein